MNKITKILLWIVGVLLVIYLFMNAYIQESENIYKLIGNKIGGGELSTSDYYSIAQCVETYKDYLTKKDYETAYQMLNYNYQKYVSLDEYKKKVSMIDYSQIHVKDIIPITASTFHILSNMSGEEYTVILNSSNNRFLLLPNTFLDYREVNQKVSKNNLKCNLMDYVVETNQNVFHFEIENQGNQEVKIHSGTLYTNLDDKIEMQNEVVIAPQESKKISISFDTEYAFPKKVILYRNVVDKSDIEYTFEIKDE